MPTLSSFTDDAGLHHAASSSALPSVPSFAPDGGFLSRLPGSLSMPYGIRYSLSSCSPPCANLTEPVPSQRGLLLPSFRRFGHPPRRRVWLRWQLSKFHRWDFHPLGRQLASLHRSEEPAPPRSVSARRGGQPPVLWPHEGAPSQTPRLTHPSDSPGMPTTSRVHIGEERQRGTPRRRQGRFLAALGMTGFMLRWLPQIAMIWYSRLVCP